ncbi:MAG: CoA-binding protein [Candidatus Marinimicrobia bacterium]|jgi:hypothetical protein|nr:CoA-binding protein [Gammaproteobacteria bacterium]MBT3727968.1 CoA-binding protein [Candidatus Neomarinimicrobiota bacterium]MBT3944002.1 CoA-binding protein [Candidatus Neomarinimicrobiota bacterium]MBT4112161.1 CoA-binding protein [Candidatus Neomarinimicrobiota bacterium]MBT4316734.1 CoA-binding protein [Candidatus Neomarinimicrobiota bacterium]
MVLQFDKLKHIFSFKDIAVVGMSPKHDRPSNKVGQYLHDMGFNVVAVNPTVDKIGSIISYPSLSDIPHSIDIIDVFRKPEFVPSITKNAIAIEAKVLWLQENIIDNESAGLASGHGIAVVMDYCILKEHKKFKLA